MHVKDNVQHISLLMSFEYSCAYGSVETIYDGSLSLSAWLIPNDEFSLANRLFKFKKAEVLKCAKFCKTCNSIANKLLPGLFTNFELNGFKQAIMFNIFKIT